MLRNKKIVLLRHGQSEWNKLNKFTGWIDINLSKEGEYEANKAAFLLNKKKFIFDKAYTSFLKRAIHTLWIILEKTNHHWIDVEKNLSLNERHYGNLQGLNKDKAIKKYGFEKVQEWRRGFYAKPPKLLLSTENSFNHLIYNDRRYIKFFLKNKKIFSESLFDTFNRVVPYWNKKIKKDIQKGKNILIVAHGNSLRALVKYIFKMNEIEIFNFEIPTSVPLVCELNEELFGIKYDFITDC